MLRQVQDHGIVFVLHGEPSEGQADGGAVLAFPVFRICFLMIPVIVPAGLFHCSSQPPLLVKVVLSPSLLTQLEEFRREINDLFRAWYTVFTYSLHLW